MVSFLSVSSDSLTFNQGKQMLPSQKIEFINSWENAQYFSEREKEYLALEVIKLSIGGDYEEQVHQILNDQWNGFDGYSAEEKVVLMTRPSGHHEVRAILRS